MAVSEILGLQIAGRSYAEVTTKSVQWARNHESRTMVFANVHVVMEAFDDPQFQAALNRMDLINPDGVPLVWALRALGETNASRVYGPDATEAILLAAQQANLSVGFYGSSQETLDKLILEVRRRCPTLQIDFVMSPPFHKLTAEEDEAISNQIIASGIRMLFVGLGCPKQERWMTAHQGRLPVVMLGVGAAFDFIAGTKPRAPHWMRRSGLEWLFRLASEPRRLFGRYVKHNPRFVILFLLQLLQHNRSKPSPRPSSSHG